MGAGRVAAAIIVGLAGMTLSACSLLPAQAAKTPTPTATPSAVPLAQQLPQLLKKGQTIGTGDLQIIDHEPFDDPRAQHPPTGKLTIVVNSSGQVEVRLRLDDPAAAATAIADYAIVLSTARHDGLPDPIEHLQFGLVSDLASVTADGELVLPLGGDEVMFGDPTFLHSVEVNVAGEGPVLAAAPIAWTLPSPYPGLTAVDHGVATFAHGQATVQDGVITDYVPNPYDTVYMVARRFGITEVQLLWLNPWMAGDPDQLKYGVPINLAASRR
ncbi:LysM peptidoglycan-binding domain-containing protein [Leifsonia sp. C5G2]|nr:LysM peptidoglycan-binding domain-containing protein [Leifsonia sp. C5G2]